MGLGNSTGRVAVVVVSCTVVVGSAMVVGSGSVVTGASVTKVGSARLTWALTPHAEVSTATASVA